MYSRCRGRSFTLQSSQDGFQQGLPHSNRHAAPGLVAVLIFSLLTAEPLLADDLTNDITPLKIIVFGASGRVGTHRSKDADKAIQRVAAEQLVETLRGMEADAPRFSVAY